MNLVEVLFGLGISPWLPHHIWFSSSIFWIGKEVISLDHTLNSYAGVMLANITFVEAFVNYGKIVMSHLLISTFSSAFNRTIFVCWIPIRSQKELVTAHMHCCFTIWTSKGCGKVDKNLMTILDSKIAWSECCCHNRFQVSSLAVLPILCSLARTTRSMEKHFF